MNTWEHYEGGLRIDMVSRVQTVSMEEIRFGTVVEFMKKKIG